MNSVDGRQPDQEGPTESAVARLTFGMLGVQRTVEGRESLVTRKGDEGIVVYGPYEECVRGGYKVEFDLGIAAKPEVLGDPVCATLEVVANNGLTYLAEKRLLLSDLAEGLSTFSLNFRLHETRVLEYRVRSSGQVGLNVPGVVRVTSTSKAPPAPSSKHSRQRSWEYEREFLDGYLRNISGLIHVGANSGQERRYYWLLGLDVIWVEPIDELYERLVDNISGYDRQRPLRALLSDEDGKEFDFQIANNNGASSSILPFEDHEKLWPGIQYVERRRLISTTLETLVRSERIAIESYQALTLDVEGAELLVLRGAGEVLEHFQYVKCEVADFPARTGTPTAEELDEFLRGKGFSQLMRRAFSMGPNGEGTYWDIVWKRVSRDEPLHEPGYKVPIIAHPQDVEGLEKSE